MKKLIFPNLNTLRFIAAMAVIVHHIELLKNSFGIENSSSNSTIFIIGKLGVVFFFVLSGFLITYLLLNEKKSTDSINFRNFYIRRVLRIFPVYYLILILSFFILPNFEFFKYPGKPFDFDNYPFKQLFLYLTMLPNLAAANLPSIPYASQSWSIGTEEQFYLLWPFLFLMNLKNTLKSMVLLIFFYITTKLFFLEHSKFLFNFWKLFNIDCMAIGGITAYIAFVKHKILNVLLNIKTFTLILLTTGLLILLGIDFGFLQYEIYALLFSIIILNFACNKRLSKTLSSNTFDYLGKISYGLYMYHVIVIFIILKFTNSSFIVYPLTILFSIIISSLSYEYFEKPFLKLKSKF